MTYPADINLIHVYKNILSGVCDHIERDSCASGRPSTAYLESVKKLGVTSEEKRAYYQLHSMFACFAERDRQTTFEHIWDVERGWTPAAATYFNFS
ncbi:MAG TPA: hypothetical protein VFT59_01605 [Candidatus Saccharimonadales bacterium]|nr:hypothetical protein [Candidatus Saccharimonadales bacterium]